MTQFANNLISKIMEEWLFNMTIVLEKSIPYFPPKTGELDSFLY